ncbi:hypothetical protein JCM14469_00460 [Desulfatiferula olefinivorans]
MKKNGDTQADKTQAVLTLSRQRALGWGAGLVVLLSLFFFLGTLVGRNMIRVDLDQDGLFLEISGSLEAENRLNLNAMEQVPQTGPEFDFFKELNKDPDDRKTVSATPPPTSAPAEKNRTVVKRRKPIVSPSQLTKAAAIAGPSDAGPKTTAPPSPADDHDPAVYKYTIQAGSFRTAEDADKMVARLKRLGYQAHWVKGLVRDDEIWFRVRIGAYRDRMDAAAGLNRLKQDNIDAFLVRR